jgi:2-polyprenyl-6-methoxyphenol hydroxylase-like FAD-dependent oxidoreductase
VARALGLRRERELAGEFALLFAYWTGLPPSEWFRTDVRQDSSLTCRPCEDGVHLVVLAGRPQVARGDRLATYLAGMRRFPATLNPRLLDRAELASRLLVAPEPALRGYFRQASGPGWALVGDAGHFKHPATGQGIGDAVEQAWFVADERGRPALRLRAGGRDWVEGAGPPAAVLEAAPFELFRALSGRRSAGQVRALAWDGDPEPYLDVLSPYPMPPSPLLE